MAVVNHNSRRGEAVKVIERAEEIRLRGRYVEERRRSVWGALG
jgi:tRNA A-37 threonylcarbamoyl transferase component Bud32